MMTTIDGKVASGVEGLNLFDDYFDLYLETEEQLSTSSWICGRVTAQEFIDFVPKNNPDGFMFVVDTKGVVRFDNNAIKLSNGTKEAELVVLVLKNTPKEYLNNLQDKRITYIIAGDDRIEWEMTLKEVGERYGVVRLLLEGGALINGSMLKNGLIDEISLLITPLILNKSGAPSLFENPLLEDLEVKKYKMKNVQSLGKDCIWARYVK